MKLRLLISFLLPVGRALENERRDVWGKWQTSGGNSDDRSPAFPSAWLNWGETKPTSALCPSAVTVTVTTLLPALVETMTDYEIQTTTVPGFVVTKTEHDTETKTITITEPSQGPVQTTTELTIETLFSTVTTSGAPITVTSSIEETTTVTGRGAPPVTVTSTITTATPICGGGTTYINNITNNVISTQYGNITSYITTEIFPNATTVYVSSNATATSTVTTTITTLVPGCGGGGNGSIDINALIVALKAYVNDTLIQTLNDSLSLSLSKSLNTTVIEAFNLTCNKCTGSNCNGNNSNTSNNVSVSINNSSLTSIRELFIGVFDMEFTDLSSKYYTTLTYALNETLTETLDNSTAFNVSLSNSTLNYFNDTFGSLIGVYIHEEFDNRSSPLYQSISEIGIDYNPWFAIPLLVLLILFGLLTLAGLAWLILRRPKKHHHHKDKDRRGSGSGGSGDGGAGGGGICERCGRPRDQCTCDD